MNLDMGVQRLFWNVEAREDKSNEGDSIAFVSKILVEACLREGRPVAIMLWFAGKL